MAKRTDNVAKLGQKLVEKYDDTRKSFLNGEENFVSYADFAKRLSSLNINAA